MARGDINLADELERLHERFLDERKAVLKKPLPTLSATHKAELAKFRRQRSLPAANRAGKDLSLEVRFFLTMDGLREIAKAPYHFSSLRDWLALETWQPKDALLLLSGVCPKAALVDWTYDNFIGAEISEPKIRAATRLNAIHDSYDVPERSAWDDEIHEVRQALRRGGLGIEEKVRLELRLKDLLRQRDDPAVVSRDEELSLRSKVLSTLSRHWFSGDHDAQKRQSPEHFLGWAAARGFKPEWYDWARSQRLIDEHEAVYREPFFDPDSDDYPVLLHIAVTAWQEVRKGGVGTPKQRIDRFLQERYPSITKTNRETICQVANWQRTGGRPKA